MHALSIENLDWMAVSGNSKGRILLVWSHGILVEGVLDPARGVSIKRKIDSPIEIDLGPQIQKQIMMNKGLTIVKTQIDCIELFSKHLNELELKSSLFSTFLSFYHPLIFATFDDWKDKAKEKYPMRSFVQDICSFYGLREFKLYQFPESKLPETEEELFAYQALLTEEGHFWQKGQVAISSKNKKDVAVFIDHDQALDLKTIKIIQYLISYVSHTSGDSLLNRDQEYSLLHLLKSNRILMLEGEPIDIVPIKNFCKKFVAKDSLFELDLKKLKGIGQSSFNYEDVMKYKFIWIDNISQMTSYDADELCRVFRKYQGHIILSDQRPLHLLNLSLFPAELRWTLEDVQQIHAQSYRIYTNRERRIG